MGGALSLMSCSSPRVSTRSYRKHTPLRLRSLPAPRAVTCAG